MSSKKITLKSSDGETFELDEEVAMLSQTIKNMIEDDCTDNGIPLPNVTSQTLVKVIEYCKKHVEKIEDDDDYKDDKLSELKAWDAEFIQVDQKTLFDLTMASDYMNIESLLDLAVHTWADMLRGKNVKDIRKTCNIKNDLTPEEEEAYRKEYPWAFVDD